MSPVGYQRVLFEPENGGQSLHGSDCATVEDLLLHGGAKSVFGLDENTYYFVLKDLRETRQDTAPDAPGRRWYMNLAVTVPARELKTLCAIAYEAYTQSQAFSARLAACLTAQDQACSYAVDTAKWNALTEAACRRYDAFAASGEPEISDTPCGRKSPAYMNLHCWKGASLTSLAKRATPPAFGIMSRLARRKRNRMRSFRRNRNGSGLLWLRPAALCWLRVCTGIPKRAVQSGSLPCCRKTIRHCSAAPAIG